MQDARAQERFLRGMARAAAGALLFSLPLLMTMEMWWLGFYLDRLRFFSFLVVAFLFLLPLTYFFGFERTGGLFEDVVDTFVAFGIGAITSAVVLLVFGIIGRGMPLNEVIGKIAIQTVPASFGAVLARGQLGTEASDAESKQKKAGYPGQLFLMGAGAVYIAFNVAPTEEMILIGFKMTPWHALGLVVISITILHAFVFTVGFRGSHGGAPGQAFATTFLRYSVVGYGIALAISLAVLWVLGRTDGASLWQVAMMVAVLAFPASLGAAAARLII